MRRTPVQERSAVRVQGMLDAAAALLDEVGPEGTTTTAVAARAQVSVGSLYQFFPDRASVLQALAQRSFSRFSDRLEQRLQDDPPRDWRTAVDVVVQEYVAFTRSEPGMQVLSFGGAVDKRMLDDAEDNNAVVADRLARVLAAAEPALVLTDRVLLAVRVAVEAADAVLDLAFRRDPDGDPAVVAEAAGLLRAYLATQLEG